MLASGASPSHFINSMVASGVWWLVAKYSGAIQSWLSRTSYSIYCNWLIGGGTDFWGNVKSYFVCKKPLEDFSNNSFSYSQQFLGFLSAGVAYWISDQFQRFWYRASPIAHAGATIDDPAGREIYLSLKLKQTQDNLRETQNRLREKEDELSELRTTLLAQLKEDKREFSSVMTNARQRLAQVKTRI